MITSTLGYGFHAKCDTFGCRAYCPLHSNIGDLETFLTQSNWGVEKVGLEGAEAVRHYCPEHKPGVKHDLTETVNHPQHYGGGDNPYEAIKVIEAWGLGFCLGNTVKYIARHGRKGSPLEDLKKASWYLQREIEKLESEKS